MYTLHTGHCLDILKTLPSHSIHCCITSPPYFNLRDYETVQRLGRNYIGIDLNPTYIAFTKQRFAEFDLPLFTEETE